MEEQNKVNNNFSQDFNKSDKNKFSLLNAKIFLILLFILYLIIPYFMVGSLRQALLLQNIITAIQYFAFIILVYILYREIFKLNKRKITLDTNQNTPIAGTENDKLLVSFSLFNVRKNDFTKAFYLLISNILFFLVFGFITLIEGGLGGMFGLIILVLPIFIILVFSVNAFLSSLFSKQKQSINTVVKINYPLFIFLLVYLLIMINGAVISVMSDKKYNNISEKINSNNVNYEFCSSIDNWYQYQECAEALLIKDNGLEMCTKLSEEGKTKFKEVLWAKSGIDCSDIVKEKETEEEKQQFNNLWDEINDKYERVYSSEILANNEAQKIGCEGYHSFLATTSQVEIEVFRPCMENKEYILAVENLPNYLFKKEIDSMANGSFLTLDEAKNFARENNFSCKTYEMILLEGTSKGDIEVFRPCDNYLQYFFEISKKKCNSKNECVISSYDPSGFETCINPKWDEWLNDKPQERGILWECTASKGLECDCIDSQCQRVDNIASCS